MYFKKRGKTSLAMQKTSQEALHPTCAQTKQVKSFISQMKTVANYSLFILF